MDILKKLGEYLYVRKKDPNIPQTKWMGYMNGMNRISLIMFVIALCIILIKFFIVPLFK